MVLYLTGGWYTQIGQRRLRDEVVDGAIDTASGLFRAGVPPHMVSGLALKIRALASYADPPHRRSMPKTIGSGRFSDGERKVMRLRLQTDTDRQPALQCFVTDCLEHVHDAMDLRGLYLHLVHITRMMQLLQVARISGAASGLLGGSADPSFHMTTGVAAEWTPPPLDDDDSEQISHVSQTPKSKPKRAAAKPKAKTKTAVKKKAAATQRLPAKAAKKPVAKKTPASKQAAPKTKAATKPRAKTPSKKASSKPNVRKKAKRTNAKARR